MSVQYGGDKITFQDGSTVASGWSGFKNRIINGDMRIDQRNAGASVTPTGSAYTLDRWSASTNVSSKYSIQQNAGAVTPPSGFNSYLGVTSLSSYSVAAGEYTTITQPIEGYNVADLGWGSANAATVTLSFYVRSSLTGTFGGALQSDSGTRSYPFTYTISAANTWEQKTITVSGDTTGTWLKTNGAGIVVRFGLGVGSTYSGTAGSWASANYLTATGATSVVGTSGATFYITGVQLEKGSTATSFDYRPYGTELALCQRYYQKFASILVGGYNGTSGNVYTMMSFPVEMRATPTLSYSGIAYSNASSLVSNVINTKLMRFGLTISSTGLGFATADLETSGAEL